MNLSQSLTHQRIVQEGLVFKLGVMLLLGMYIIASYMLCSTGKDKMEKADLKTVET